MEQTTPLLHVTRQYGYKPNLNLVKPIAETFEVPSPMMKALVETLNSVTRNGSHADDDTVDAAVEIDVMIDEKKTQGFLDRVVAFLDHYIQRLDAVNKLNRINVSSEIKADSLLEKINKMFVLLALNGIISIHNAINMTDDAPHLVTTI